MAQQPVHDWGRGRDTLRLSVTGPPPRVPGDDHFGGMIESLVRLSQNMPRLTSLAITLNTNQ